MLPSVLLFVTKFRKDQYPNNAMNSVHKKVSPFEQNM